MDTKSIPSGTPAHEPEPSYRALGLLITIMLGFVLFAVGMVAQLLIYSLREIAIKYGLDDPVSGSWFYQSFGLRGTEYLLAISLWPWWFLLAIYFRCAYQFPDNIQFSRVFGYSLITWGTAVLVFIGFGATIAGMPFVILLSGIGSPHMSMKVVPLVSWLLPTIVIGMIIYWTWKTIRFERNPTGGLQTVRRPPAAKPSRN